LAEQRILPRTFDWLESVIVHVRLVGLGGCPECDWPEWVVSYG